MIAGMNILCMPGFSVEPGGYFHGYIAPEGPWCIDPTKAATTPGKTVASPIPAPLQPVKPFFRVYPNPTTGDFTIALKGYIPAEPMTVSVYNTNGLRVYETVISDTMKTDLTLDGQPSGLYLVRIDTPTRSASVRIVKL
jgi:hypothetical protein